MKWKALEVLGKLGNQTRNNYGLKSNIDPPFFSELPKTGSDLLMIIYNV